MAEDARLIALKRREEARAAAAARREAEAKAQAAAEAERRARAEAERAEAERERVEAERAAAAAARETQAAQVEAERARRTAEEAERERAEMRRRLTEQFSRILETRETVRGLILSLSDVLFDTGHWTLKPGAREQLAKIAGIVQAHPGLRLQVGGHTDSVGSEEFNERLSERRADAVRDFLVHQGVAASSITAQGFGESRPIATNDTAAGRQLNRRVEIVVSGDAIGAPARPTTSLRQ
jgi:outer membrane protein OmpA-like peptidoglycan-associated protein